MSRWLRRRMAQFLGASLVLFAGCSPALAGSAPPAGLSVDHPPAGGRGALRQFARCMRTHGVRMREPTDWAGHPGRLLVYLPPHNRRTRPAYRSCDHLRVAAKQQGGPH
jgi:hypothetical protein